MDLLHSIPVGCETLNSALIMSPSRRYTRSPYCCSSYHCYVTSIMILTMITVLMMMMVMMMIMVFLLLLPLYLLS